MGNAVIENFTNNEDFYGTFNNIDLLVLIPACYVVPFGSVIIFMFVAFIIMIWFSRKENFKINYYEKVVKPLMSEVRLQANTTAAVVVCSLLTFSVSSLDMVSVIIETNLPSYYFHNISLYL